MKSRHNYYLNKDFEEDGIRGRIAIICDKKGMEIILEIEACDMDESATTSFTKDYHEDLSTVHNVTKFYEEKRIQIREWFNNFIRRVYARREIEQEAEAHLEKMMRHDIAHALKNAKNIYC